MDSPYWKGPSPGVDVQRRYLWKTFRGKPNSIPGSARKRSASARNPVRLPPGMLFGLPRNTHDILADLAGEDINRANLLPDVAGVEKLCNNLASLLATSQRKYGHFQWKVEVRPVLMDRG